MTHLNTLQALGALVVLIAMAACETGGPVTGYPISYAADAKQYIAVAVGGGGIGAYTMAAMYPKLKSAHCSNILMVFALGE